MKITNYIKKSKECLDDIVEESDLNNIDCFITALLGIEPEEAINIPNDKIQKVLKICITVIILILENLFITI